MSLDQPGPVAEHDAAPVDRLKPWLEQALGRPIQTLQTARFGRGFSNLTFLLDADGEQLVLRRPPPGVKVAAGHDMVREGRILAALRPVWGKVPEVVALESDTERLGGGFYVMRRVPGVILRDRPPKDLDLSAPVMRRASEGMVDTLAEIHGIDVAATGLAGLGRPEGYVARQVGGWSQRYVAARTDDLPDMEWLAQRLADTQPPERGACLVHNDFKYDNVLLDPDDLGVVRAVLDWEMATIGDPWLDLGTTLAYWVQADDPEELQRLRMVLTWLPGNLTRAGVVDRYALRVGRAEDPVWAYAFGLFKLAVVVQQLYARYTKGLTTEARYAGLLPAVAGLAVIGRRVLQRDRIDDLG